MPSCRFGHDISDPAGSEVKICVWRNRDTGQRHGKPVIYKVHSGDMARNGNTFYRSVNGVWLTKVVMPEYLERL